MDNCSPLVNLPICDQTSSVLSQPQGNACDHPAQGIITDSQTLINPLGHPPGPDLWLIGDGQLMDTWLVYD